MKSPNILFVLTDQQRPDSLGCYGQKLPTSPNLDKMASEGVLFTNAFSCQPVCGPARAVLQTGLYATETGCYRNCIALKQNDKTIAKYLTKSGYDVGYVGKWHLASNCLPTKEEIGPKFKYTKKAVPLDLRGGYNSFWRASDALEFTSKSYKGHVFDAATNKINYKGQYRVDFLTDQVLSYLETRDKIKPFFLFVGYLEPHQQNRMIVFGKIEGPKGSSERFKDYDPPGDLIGTQGNWRKYYPNYLGCCNSIDYNMGRILAKLEELHLKNDTIIVYTSDHGCHFKTRNSEYKRSCHDASIRVPLIIRGPGFKGGKKITDLVSLIDLPPTVLYIAGAEVPNYMHGRPLHDIVTGTAKDWPSEIFVQISESQVGRAIRNKKWKYSVRAPFKTGFLRAHSDVYYEDFLYDLEKDPFEKQNLVEKSEYSSIRTQLAEDLIRKMKEANESAPKILPKQKNR